MDRLADGSLALIDYKSGKCSYEDWFGERPGDPQMMLYVQGLEQMPGTMAYAVLRPNPKEMKFKGLCMDDQKPHLPDSHLYRADRYGPPNRMLPWDGLKLHWQAVLKQLSEAFQRGEAQVDPLVGACQYCALGPLCRIHEAQPSATIEAGVVQL